MQQTVGTSERAARRALRCAGIKRKAMRRAPRLYPIRVRFTQLAHHWCHHESLFLITPRITFALTSLPTASPACESILSRHRPGDGGRNAHRKVLSHGCHAPWTHLGEDSSTPVLEGVSHVRCRSAILHSASRWILLHDRFHVRRVGGWTQIFVSENLRCTHSDSITFSAVFIWCGFQTGNTVQVRAAVPGSRWIATLT